MEINEVKYGFKLLNIRHVEEINVDVYEFIHLYSGAKTVYVKTEDKNSVFAIAFKTPPVDGTGVSHILEHSVLCGSKKYPLKEPFVNLLKSSLATFLNAFTSSDWTMYPCASQTPKDFDNLVSVYLDAVFNPLSLYNPKAFLQEGWHLELFNKEDLPSIKGVVYNEMKGATSSVEDILYLHTMKTMYKDTSYRFNAGGDPLEIPNLTYEMYKDFYYKHYTPENALTYFYGDFDIEKKLKMLDEEYFSKYQKKGIDIKLLEQKPHVNLNEEIYYPLLEDEDEQDNTHISLCYAFGKHKNKEELLACSILFSSLLARNDSPLKKVILDASIGKNLSYNFDDSNPVSNLYLHLENTSFSSKKKFKEIFENEVKKLVEKGIDKKLILATLNHSEFVDKEFDSGREPRGLIIMFNMVECFIHGEDIIDKLTFNSYYKNLREKLDTDYFEKLLEKYILNSNHVVEVICKPSKTLDKENEIKFKQKMEEIKNGMSLKEIEETIKTNIELIEYQNKVDDKKALKTMPKLSLKDIPSSINYSKVKNIKNKDYKIHFQNINTNKISYLEMYFSLKKLTFEELPYLYILERLLSNMPTKNYSELELVNEIKTYLGELSFSKTVFTKGKHESYPYFIIKSCSLEQNIDYMPKLIHEVLYKSKFLKKNIKRILNQKVEYLKQDLLEAGMANATLESRKSLSDSSLIASVWSRGQFLYRFMKDINDNYDHEKFVSKMNELIYKIFNKNNVEIFISGDKEIIKKTKKSLKYLRLKNNVLKDVLSLPLIEKENSAFVMQSGVSYNVMSNNLEDFGYKFNVNLLILSQIVNFDYLWNNVRVKGGAYGCSLAAYKSGELILSSYRDPNVKSTYEVFDGLGDFIRSYNPTRNEFNSYIISALGGYDVPRSIPSLITYWNTNYLLGISKEILELDKREMLNVKIEDIKALAQIFDDMKVTSCRCTFGNETAIKTYNFDKIKTL